MSNHPSYYTDLLQRRFADGSALTPNEHRELDLHLLICPECNYVYAQLLRLLNPETAELLLQRLKRALTADLVMPYLRDLARAMQASQPLTSFQRFLWRFIQRDREALGYFRAVEADVYISECGMRTCPERSRRNAE